MENKKLKKISIKFPVGGGGHWLSHLCYCLENNKIYDTNIELNFHNHTRSENLIFGHFLETYDILLSTKYKFNLFLNFVLKTKPYNIPDNWFEDADNYVNQARGIQSIDWQKNYETNIDLDLSMTVKNPEKFTDTLFKLLKNLNFKFHPNKNLVDEKIKQFVKTCPNPYDYIGNLNDKHWQVWCLGFFEIDKVLVKYNNVQQVIDQIKEDNDYYTKITEQWSYV